MTKVEFDIPKSVIAETAKKKIESLERQVKSRDAKISTLEYKISGLETTLKEREELTQKIHTLIEDLKYDKDFEDLWSNYY